MPSPEEKLAAAGIPRCRVKIFEVSPLLLLTMGRGVFEVCEDPLPDDVVETGLSIDETTGNLLVRVHSNAFPEVPESHWIPRISPWIRRFEPPAAPPPVKFREFF